MNDEDKTREELLAEVRMLRARVQDLSSARSDQDASPDVSGLDASQRRVVEDQRLVCRCRPDGMLTFVNDAFCHHFDRPREALIGRSFLPLVADGDRDRLRAHLQGLGLQKRSAILEHRVIAARGELRWHLRVDRVRLDPAGQAAEVETVARDITADHQRRSDVRDRDTVIQAFFECAAEGIVTVNRAGEMVLVNPRAEAMFGYERGQLVGQRLEVLIPERHRQAHAQHQAEYFAQPRTRSMGLGLTLTGRRRDGSEFPIEVSLTAIPDQASGLAMAFVTDISERVARDRQARHVEKLVALGSLAAGVAHELNNPIGIIHSRLELMLMEVEDQGPPTEWVDDLRVLQRHSQRLARIAQGLLSFGRQRERQWRPVDLNEVVEETLLLAGKQLVRDGIHVITLLHDGLPRILGEPTALEQVVMNLLFNARDAMPTGGTVRIETGPGSPEAGGICVVVSDTGEGMPPEVLARIAEPFFTTKANGTGLGLSVSYAIIREHGGTIAVQSEPGRGTTFTLSLPAATGQAPA